MVVAIIAILAALLLPALQRARDRAKSINCLSNLKQTYSSLAFYADSNQNRIPAPYTWGYGPKSGMGDSYWVHWLAYSEYGDTMKYAKIWYCPLVPLQTSLSSYGLVTEFSGSYMKFDTGKKLKDPPMSINYNVSPSRKIILGDAKNQVNYANWDSGIGLRCSSTQAYGTLSLVEHGNKKANVALHDGHVESLDQYTAVKQYQVVYLWIAKNVRRELW